MGMSANKNLEEFECAFDACLTNAIYMASEKKNEALAEIKTKGCACEPSLQAHETFVTWMNDHLQSESALLETHQTLST